jgi:2-dehydropantoate 2-reductase
MRFAVIGAGAVGGYYGALLSKAGHDVSFVARGAHLEAIRANGLRIISAPDVVGDFTVRCPAESDPGKIGVVDTVIFAIKTYDNAATLPTLAPLLGANTTVLTLQNGVDSAEEVAASVGEARTLGGATYIATGIESPGVIRQNGTHRRIVCGEYFAPGPEVSPRASELETIFKAANIHGESVPDIRVPLWEKFIYLAPMAAFTGASRLPIGATWNDAHNRAMYLDAVDEVERVAIASGISVVPGVRNRIEKYTAGIPPSTRSSLLIDLSQGKRIEVEALQGSVVRRGKAAGVATPIMSALYAVLKPWAGGPAA